MNPYGATSFTAGPICLDEFVTVLGQYPEDVRWNGFLCPVIDPLAVEEVMAALYPADGDFEWETRTEHRWADDGSLDLILTSYDGDSAYVERISPDEDGLYGLGAYGWVWTADEEAEVAS